MTNIARKTYLVGVVERAIAYYKIDAEHAGDAAENWDAGDLYARDEEALESEGPCNIRERQPDGQWRNVPPAEWEPGVEVGRFNQFEIEPRIRYWEDGDPLKPDHVMCDEHEADMWRLYRKAPDQDWVCVGEYATRALAENVLAAITGRCYGSPSWISNDQRNDSHMTNTCSAHVFGAHKLIPTLLAACRMVVGRWERGDLAEAARSCARAIEETEAVLGLNQNTPIADNARAADASSCGDPAEQRFSVLLLYPDYLNDGGRETFFAWVEAKDSIEAVSLAQQQAIATNEWTDIAPAQFHPLLVTAGHQYGLPVSND